MIFEPQPITPLKFRWEVSNIFLVNPTSCFLKEEVGMRDLTVTGVQTCALPISRLPGALSRRGDTSPGDSSLRARAAKRAVADRLQGQLPPLGSTLSTLSPADGAG